MKLNRKGKEKNRNILISNDTLSEVFLFQEYISIKTNNNLNKKKEKKRSKVRKNHCSDNDALAKKYFHKCKIFVSLKIFFQTKPLEICENTL